MRAISIVVAVTLAGCGLTMTRGPDPHRPGRRPECTESMTAPKRDAIGAIVGLVAAVFGGVALEVDNTAVGAPLLIGGLGVMVASYASGGVGYYRVKRCREAIAAWDRMRQMQVPLTPAP